MKNYLITCLLVFAGSNLNAQDQVVTGFDGLSTQPGVLWGFDKLFILDINSDGIADLVVSAPNGQAPGILEENSGYLDIRSGADYTQLNIITVPVPKQNARMGFELESLDYDDDGTSEILAMEENGNLVHLFDETDFTHLESWDGTTTNTDTLEKLSTIQDMNSDGIPELAVFASATNIFELNILSGADGLNISTTEFPSGLFHEFGDVIGDINSDGTDEILFYRYDNGTNEHVLSSFSADTLEVRQTYDVSEFDNVRPVQGFTYTNVDDRNGDGVRDILIGVSAIGSDTVLIRFIDGFTAATLEETTIQRFDILPSGSEDILLGGILEFDLNSTGQNELFLYFGDFGSEPLVTVTLDSSSYVIIGQWENIWIYSDEHPDRFGPSNPGPVYNFFGASIRYSEITDDFQGGLLITDDLSSVESWQPFD